MREIQFKDHLSGHQLLKALNVLDQRHHREMIVHEYSRWIDDLLRRGRGQQVWYGSLLSLMFDDISGDFHRRKWIMFDEVERFYSTLICHMIRDPRSPSQRLKLPIGLFALDCPTLKQCNKAPPGEITTVNEGLHVHGIMLVHIDCRLRRHLKDHLDPSAKWHSQYVRDDRPLRHIDVQPIRTSADFVTDYALKSLKGKLPDLDNLLVLPKSRSELSARTRLPRVHADSRQ